MTDADLRERYPLTYFYLLAAFAPGLAPAARRDAWTCVQEIDDARSMFRVPSMWSSWEDVRKERVTLLR